MEAALITTLATNCIRPRFIIAVSILQIFRYSQGNQYSSNNYWYSKSDLIYTTEVLQLVAMLTMSSFF